MLMPLQFITQILWVQENAPADIWLILVAFIGAARGIGALTFGLYGGALADRYDRRKLILVTQALLLLTTLAISALMYVSVGSAPGFVLFFFITFLTVDSHRTKSDTLIQIGKPAVMILMRMCHNTQMDNINI